MNTISPRIHGLLDFIAVIFFLVAPTIFGFTGLPMILAYSLGVVHLIITLITSFPVGLTPVIPFPVHGWIELVVSVTLIVLPWLLGFSEVTGARNFYVLIGALLLVVWIVTHYTGHTHAMQDARDE